MSIPPPPQKSDFGKNALFTSAFIIVTFSSLLYFVGVGALFPVLPRFVADPLGGSDKEVGLVVAAFSITAVFLRPFAGRIGDRRGRKLIVVLGAAVIGLTTAAFVWATSVPILVFLRLWHGVGEALFFTGVAAMVTDLSPVERRGEGLSFFTVSVFLGLAVGPLLGELIFESFGYNAVWLVAAGLALLAAAIGLPLPDTRPDEISQQGPLINRKGLLPGIVMAASFWGFAGYSTFVPLYALEVGMSGSRYLFATYSTMALLMRVFGAKIPDRFGSRRTGAVSLVCSIVALTVLATWATPTGLVIGTVLLGLGASLSFPAIMALAVSRASDSERASVIGTFTGSIDVAFGIGPLSLGFVAEAGGYQAVFAAAAVIGAAGLVLLLQVTSARGTLAPIETFNDAGGGHEQGS